MTNTIELKADELETIRTVLRTAANAMKHASWPDLNQDEQGNTEPNATYSQGARLLELNTRSRTLGTLGEMDRTTAADLADALDWACGQLAWAPLWEIAGEQESDQARIEEILYDCEVSSLLRTFAQD